MKRKKTTDKKLPTSSSELKQRLRILHTKGLTSAEIAVECNINVSIVRKMLNEMGYKENPERSKDKHIWADSCQYKSEELRKRYGS